MNNEEIFTTSFDWVSTADIYNKRFEKIPEKWMKEQADIIALLFNAKGIDKDGIIERFYEIYETIKHLNVPIEVVYVPMDENVLDMKKSFRNQANWFTLKFHDPLVPSLKYMYGVTCIPQIIVIKPNGLIVSRNGVADLEKYGKNAVITWLSPSKRPYCKNAYENSIYDRVWTYVGNSERITKGPKYKRKFTEEPEDTENISVYNEIKNVENAN